MICISGKYYYYVAISAIMYIVSVTMIMITLNVCWCRFIFLCNFCKTVESNKLIDRKEILGIKKVNTFR